MHSAVPCDLEATCARNRSLTAHSDCALGRLAAEPSVPVVKRILRMRPLGPPPARPPAKREPRTPASLACFNCARATEFAANTRPPCAAAAPAPDPARPTPLRPVRCTALHNCAYEDRCCVLPGPCPVGYCARCCGGWEHGGFGRCLPEWRQPGASKPWRQRTRAPAVPAAAAAVAALRPLVHPAADLARGSRPLHALALQVPTPVETTMTAMFTANVTGDAIAWKLEVGAGGRDLGGYLVRPPVAAICATPHKGYAPQPFWASSHAGL